MSKPLDFWTRLPEIDRFFENVAASIMPCARLVRNLKKRREDRI